MRCIVEVPPAREGASRTTAAEPRDDRLELRDAHVDVLEDVPVEERQRHVSVLAFGLKTREQPQDDAFFPRETITRIGDVVAHGPSIDVHPMRAART